MGIRIYFDKNVFSKRITAKSRAGTFIFILVDRIDIPLVPD